MVKQLQAIVGDQGLREHGDANREVEEKREKSEKCMERKRGNVKKMEEDKKISTSEEEKEEPDDSTMMRRRKGKGVIAREKKGVGEKKQVNEERTEEGNGNVNHVEQVGVNEESSQVKKWKLFRRKHREERKTNELIKMLVMKIDDKVSEEKMEDEKRKKLRRRKKKERKMKTFIRKLILEFEREEEENDIFPLVGRKKKWVVIEREEEERGEEEEVKENQKMEDGVSKAKKPKTLRRRLREERKIRAFIKMLIFAMKEDENLRELQK